LPVLLAAVLVSCKFIAGLTSFDPNAPTNEKWQKISAWVPGGSGYLVVVDVKRFSSTQFYKDVLADSSIKSLAMVKGLDTEGGSGIVAATAGLFFIGGKFDDKKVTENIGAELEKQKMPLVHEEYGGKTVHSDKSGSSAFTFLEKYLLCFGGLADIKKLIDDKNAGKIAPPQINPLQELYGKIGPGVNIYGKMSELLFSATAASNLNIKAYGRFPSENDAMSFVTDAEGIKAIKTIQSIDEPWLADVIDNIALKQNGASVDMSLTLEPPAAKNILRKVLK